MKKLFFFTLILLVMSSGVWGADVKVTALPEATEGAGGDLLIIVDDPSGSATTKKITLTNLFGSTSTFSIDPALMPSTFTGNHTFGDADTDTLTLRSLLVGGNSRAVWIAGSAPTPSYATGTNELYVGGDIESGGNVYAANFISTGTGESYISFGNNSSGRSPTAGAYEMYVDTGVFKLNQNGTEYTVPIATTDYTLSITTTGNTTVTLPTSGTLATLGGEETFSGAKTFSSIITANANLAVGNGSTGPGQVRLMEDSDNGTDYSTITGASDAGSYPSFTFSGSQGSEDLTLAVTAANTWTVSSSTGVNKIISAIAFNVPLQAVEVDGHTDQTSLTAADVSGTVIYNTGQGAEDVFLLLPTAAAGYSFVATVGTAQSNHFGVQAAPGDKIYLIASDGTVAAGDDNAAVVMTEAQVGQSFACWTFKTDAYDWMCKAISIGTSTFAAHAHSTP